MNFLHTLGRTDDCKELDVLAAAFFQKRDGVARAAARCEHRIYEHNDFFVDSDGKFAVIFLRLERLLVTIHTDMSDLCGGEQRQNSVDHAESCP